MGEFEDPWEDEFEEESVDEGNWKCWAATVKPSNSWLQMLLQ
jgi:hypothetical protein